LVDNKKTLHNASLGISGDGGLDEITGGLQAGDKAVSEIE